MRILLLSILTCLALSQNLLAEELGSDIYFHPFKSGEREAPVLIFKDSRGRLLFIHKSYISIQYGSDNVRVTMPRSVLQHPHYVQPTKVIETAQGVLLLTNSAILLLEGEQLTTMQLPMMERQFLANNNVLIDMVALDGDRLLIASILHLFEISLSSGEVKELVIPKSLYPEEIITAFPRNLLVHQGSVWVATRFAGLLEFSVNEHLKFKRPQGLKQHTINVVHPYSKERLLVGTDNGLFLYDVLLGTSQRLFAKEIDKEVTRLTPNAFGEWYLTTVDSVFKVSANLQQVKDLSDKRNFYGVNEKINATSLYVDNEDIVWFGVQNNGVYLHHPSRQKVTALKGSDSMPSAMFSQVYDYLDQDDGEYVVASYNGAFISRHNLAINEPVYSIYLANDGDIWLGGENKVWQVNSTGKALQHDLAGLSLGKITSLIIDEQQRLWVATELNGLSVVAANFKQKQSLSFLNLSYEEAHGIHSLFRPKGKASKVYMAGTFGVYTFDGLQLEKLLSSTAHNITQAELLGQRLYLLNFDQKIITIDLASAERSEVSLPVNRVSCFAHSRGSWLLVQQDRQALFWQPDLKKTVYLKKSDGLPETGLTSRFCHSKQSSAVLSSHDGLYRVNMPLEINQYRNAIHLFSSDFSHSKGHLGEVKATDLPLFLRLYSDSYAAVDDNQIYYRIGAVSETWKLLDKQLLVLNELPQGFNSVEVYAANNDGIQGNLFRVELSVLAPIWLSWWAYTLYISAFLVIVWGAQNWRHRKLAEKTKMLQLLVDKRTKELSLEKKQVETLLASKQQDYLQISHELRTPITLIRGPVAQVLERSNNPETVSLLKIADSNCERLSHLVEQLLSLEQLQSAKLQLFNVAIDDSIKSIVSAFEQAAKSKNINITCSLQTAVEALLPQSFLETVLGNLLSNAIKYSPENSVIEIVTFLDNRSNSFKLAVRDQGSGIEPSEHSKIFEKFYRTHIAATSNEQGSGIGLALVKALVDSINGSIKLSSEVGKGSCFQLAIPLQQGIGQGAPNFQSLITPSYSNKYESKEAVLTQEKEPSLQQRPMVLVIEDNQDMRQYLTVLLTKRYQVITANDGIQGIQVAREQVPELIICDVMMPMQDGFETVTQLKQLPETSHIPIILLTARGEISAKLKGFDVLADDYLAKPFLPNELFARLRSLLENRVLLRQKYAQSKSSTFTDVPELPKAEQQFVDKLEAFIGTHFQQSRLQVDDMAEGLYMSKRSFQRKLKAVTGLSPVDYLRLYRLERSKVYLEKGYSVINTAEEVGFSSQTYFSKCFKEHYEMSPKQYQLEKNAVN